MTIVESLKSIVKPAIKLPAGFVHNADFDAALLAEALGEVPDFVYARNGHRYIYFENMNIRAFELARAMGFEPFMHKSHKYTPAKIIYRAHVGRDTPITARRVANKLHLSGMDIIGAYDANPQYIKYIENYKIKTK